MSLTLTNQTLMDKYIVIAFVAIIAGLIAWQVTAINNYSKSCQMSGGTVVYTYGAINCWKGAGYISVK